ncbi:hypothetical protein J2T15_005741 [Paenibacillus harenae]|uniref:YcxB family protein n=1 Tax=Paenibacillus harenae TaxID=306543 RepID=A0ABT9U9E0_PAEHA|nr:hypothetical protein [Paenibacillus harenae]
MTNPAFSIHYRYTLLGSFQQIWSELFGKHPYRVLANAIITICGLLLAINTKELLITISMLCWLVTIYFGLKLIASLVLVPLFFYLRMRKHGEVYMAYSVNGVEMKTNKESGIKEWGHYKQINVNESSFQMVRRDNIDTHKISRSVFKDDAEFQRFHTFVQQRLRMAETRLAVERQSETEVEG